MAAKYQEKIVTLWAVFLLGTLFHTQLGLMPLFHNQSIALSNARATDNIAWILWSMLGFFVVPMVAMIATLFDDSKRYRKLHFGMTIFYSAMNLFHLVADLLVKPIAWYQIALMVVLFIIGLVLNLVSFQWMQARNNNLWRAHQATLESQ
jgi:ABC-type multidrug transport system fused ATPase/permease subunit